MIAIVDYDMGNLRSVAKAFEAIGASCEVTRDPNKIAAAAKVVVPGVGAFQDCMANLKSYGLVEVLKQAIASGKPYLGICLGMQILMDESEEAPGVAGLGIFPGAVRRFSRNLDLKVPHMGWNQLKVQKDSRLLQNIPENSYVYFVHSYYVQPEDPEIIASKTDYGLDFTSCIEKDNIYATQFHPEKSQDLGLHILKNFWKLT